MAGRRTDLALEAKEIWEEGAAEAAVLEGVEAAAGEREGFPTETVRILDQRGEEALGKPAGRYVTLTLDGLARREEGAFGRAARAVAGELAGLLDELPLDQFYEELILRTGYATMLESKNTVEDRTRLENVRELLTSIHGYLENAGEEPSLAGFLDEIALYTDLDSHDPDQDCVVMMTMHSAKGLEFPVVFVVGAEEGIACATWP